MSEQQGTMTLASRSQDLKRYLDERTAEIAAALPSSTLTPDHFKRVVLTLCARNTDLMTKCDKGSLIRAIMESAQLGLKPDIVLGEAWFVPFKGQVQLIPGYKGLVKLAWQSDRLARIAARPVFEGDAFDFEYGLEESLTHRPAFASDKLTHVYSVAKIKGGETMFHIMTIAEVMEVKARSPAGNSKFSPWNTGDFNAMALKSTLRRLCKLLPMSTTDTRLAAAIDHDMRAEHGLKQHFSAPLLSGASELADAEMDDEAALADAARAAEMAKGDA